MANRIVTLDKCCRRNNPPSIALDIIGKRFGGMRAVAFAGYFNNRPYLIGKCDCGEEFITSVSHVKAGHVRSCGCTRGRKLGVLLFKHGYSETDCRAYTSWRAMRERCRNPKAKAYRYYGGRGITVCERWNDFGTFLTDMGHPPTETHSIHRLDNDGPYAPGNCKWATVEEQVSNNSANWNIAINGVRHTAAQATRYLGWKAARLYKRIYELGFRKDQLIPIERLCQ